VRVIVLGAGLMGVTTAYELLRDGHEVMVLERNAEPAEEASGANAGLIAPGHARAWASPKVPGMLLRSLYRNDQAFRIRLHWERRFWAWTWAFLAQCTAARARVNTLRTHRLCVYSQQRLQQIVAETGLQYHRREGGLLYLFRNAASLARGVADMRVLADTGQQIRVLTPAELARLEPVYAGVGDKLAGAVHTPTDESGDSRAFALGLAEYCRRAGAQLVTGANVTGIEAQGDIVAAVTAGGQTYRGDAYVLALGAYSAALARSAGDVLPVYPVKGYSMTVPLDPQATLPQLGGVDEDNLVAFSRMGERLRVTAVAELAGFDLSHTPRDFESMRNAVTDLLPHAADYSRATYRACLRPMTPSGTPLFGPGRLRNLYYNTGHGHMGWTMACGSARITADLIAGRTPAVDLTGLRVS